MPPPFRDIEANALELARQCELQIEARRLITRELQRELEDLQKQIAACRQGHPLWPRALGLLIGLVAATAVHVLAR